jgi:hypothetical protein
MTKVGLNATCVIVDGSVIESNMMKRTSTSYAKDKAGTIGRSLAVDDDSPLHVHQRPRKSQTSLGLNDGPRRRRRQPFHCTASSLVVSVLVIAIISLTAAMVSRKNGANSRMDVKKIDEGHLLRHMSSTANNTVFSSLNTSSSSLQRSSLWYWIGIVRDAGEVQPAIWDYMVQLNCQPVHPIMVHILVGSNKEHGIQERDKRLPENKSLLGCAPFLIEDEHDDMMILHSRNGASVAPIPSNNSRVERIARIRDAQRERLRILWKEQRGQREGLDASEENNDIVMVADLDLYSFPPVDKIISQINTMNGQDAVCAAGVTMAHAQEMWYYDTFALIFLPDTFAHPLQRRLVKEFYTGEDPSLVRSDNQNGAFTQGDIMRHLHQTAAQSPMSNAPVRSCFAGLAIYRAATYFTDECQYSVQLPDRVQTSSGILSHPLYRYASTKDGRPCEHVVFHSCLHDTAAKMGRPPIQIAVNPNLIALWKKSR